jgi:hypothetical protein
VRIECGLVADDQMASRPGRLLLVQDRFHAVLLEGGACLPSLATVRIAVSDRLALQVHQLYPPHGRGLVASNRKHGQDGGLRFHERLEVCWQSLLARSSCPVFLSAASTTPQPALPLSQCGKSMKRIRRRW